MSFELIFDKKAASELSKLPKDIQKRIFTKLQQSKENPQRFFERLSGRLDYKLRIGKYRVIADLNHDKKQIQITTIGHRKNIYEKE